MSNETLSAEAVDAAARALYGEEANESMGFDAWPDYDDPRNAGREIYEQHARAALSAALPHLHDAARAEVERLNVLLGTMDHFAEVAQRVESRNNELHAEVDRLTVERDEALARVERVQAEVSHWEAEWIPTDSGWVESCANGVRAALAGRTEGDS